MYLRNIGIVIADQLLSYEELLSYRFHFNSRFISNYLSRELRKKAVFSGGDYSMIHVVLDKHSHYKESQVFHSLDVHLPLSNQEFIRYNSLSELKDRYEWCLSFIEQSFLIVSKKRGIPVKVLLSLNESFRENDYRNEWLFKRIKVNAFGLDIYLKCYFTTFDFRLELEAYDLNHTTIKTKGVVLRTMPDEICFKKEFRTVEVREECLLIKDFLGNDSFEISLDQLGNGEFHVTDKRDNQPDYNSFLDKIYW